MATPPPNFPSSVVVQSDIYGKVTLDASVFGTWLGCDTMTADFAFTLQQLGNRPGTAGIISTQEEKSNLPFSFAISPNPNAGKFSLRLLQNELKSDDQFTFRLYDITGRVLLINILYSTYSDLDLTKYSRGCYYISVALLRE